MKKFTKILAVCMLLAITVFSFASCGILESLGIGEKEESKTGLEKAADELGKKSYLIYYVGRENIAESEDVAIMLEFFEIKEEPVEALIASSNGLDFYYAFKFEDESTAQNAYEQLDIDALIEGYGSDIFSVGINDKIVYVGTNQGIKDAHGE